MDNDNININIPATSGNANISTTNESVSNTAEAPLEKTILKQGEIKMADIITGTVSGFVNNTPEATLAAVSDVRREGAEHTNEIVKEGLKGDYNTQGAIKDARFDINGRIADAASSSADRFFAVGRDLSDLRAQVINVLTDIKNNQEIGTLQTKLYISEDGERTRGLINDLKYQDLNRALIERNTELVEERHIGRHWRHGYDQSQWAALNSQLQAFQSQLSEARQGMVNFGTMAGVGQTSSQNQVR